MLGLLHTVVSTIAAIAIVFVIVILWSLLVAASIAICGITNKLSKEVHNETRESKRSVRKS